MAIDDQGLSVDTSDNNPSEKTASTLKWEERSAMLESLEPEEGDATHIGQMDLRVGCIIFATGHEADENLYIEEIDVGTYDESRLLATSLVSSYPKPAELLKKKVVVWCNVHPMDRREIGSKSGLMLVATKHFEDKEEYKVCEVSEGEPGARVYVDGFPNEPFPPSEEELYQFVLRDFKLNSEGIVTYKDLPLKVEGTSNGYVSAQAKSDFRVKFD